MKGENVSEITGKLACNTRKVTLHISNGKIADIEPHERPNKSRDQNYYIAPGLIDNQVNGYLGVDFTGPDLTMEKIKKVTRGLWKKGITTYLPTLITSNPLRITENLSTLAEAKKDSEIGLSLPGFHLEGPYISPKVGYRGAHQKEWIRKPDWNEFISLVDASSRNILQVTIAS